MSANMSMERTALSVQIRLYPCMLGLPMTTDIGSRLAIANLNSVVRTQETDEPRLLIARA